MYGSQVQVAVLVKALAIKFATEGWQVAASARRENLLQDLNKIIQIFIHFL